MSQLTNRRLGFDRDSLVSTMAEGANPKFLLFWGHSPADPSRLGKECLSQWYEASFGLDGHHFATAEHYMMFEKARLFGDHTIAKRILEAQHPKKAKALGRQVAGFDHKVWERERTEIVVRGNRGKFSQNPKLLDFLLRTSERVLVEASPVDRIWGIGLGENHQHAQQPEKWRGMNLLGFSLMRVREQLKSSLDDGSEVPRL